MRTKYLIVHSNLSKVKNISLPTYLQGNYRENLGELRNTSFVVFRPEGVHLFLKQL